MIPSQSVLSYLASTLWELLNSTAYKLNSAFETRRSTASSLCDTSPLSTYIAETIQLAPSPALNPS